MKDRKLNPNGDDRNHNKKVFDDSEEDTLSTLVDLEEEKKHDSSNSNKNRLSVLNNNAFRNDKNVELEMMDMEPVMALPMYFDHLEKRLKRLKLKIMKYDKSPNIAAVKERKRKKAERCMKEVAETIQRVQCSLNSASPEQKMLYEFDFGRMKVRFAKLQDNFNEMKRDYMLGRKPVMSDRERLIEGAPTPDVAMIPDGEVRLDIEPELQNCVELKEILDLQYSDIERLQSMVDLNDNTITIGQKTAERLKAQREKMGIIQNDLNEIGTGLKRAKKEISSLYRHLACDRCLCVCCFLVIFLVLAFIIANFVLLSLGIKIVPPPSLISHMPIIKNSTSLLT